MLIRLKLKLNRATNYYAKNAKLHLVDYHQVKILAQSMLWDTRFNCNLIVL